MTTVVLPKNVSPLIRAGRYILLICGIYYGIKKKQIYRELEKIRKPKRIAAIKEEARLKAINERLNSIAELKRTFEEIDFEPEPGWEDVI